MLVTKAYDRARALAYAEKWAFSRNPLFPDYTGNGGNCTNFVSQCLYAGSCVMNPTPVFGWYYYAPEERTASWTGVRYLYNFLTGNVGIGPYATEASDDALEVGDLIQLARNTGGFYHTLLVTGAEDGRYLVAAHSDDAFDRPLDTYKYDYARFIHIEGVRIEAAGYEDCFDALYNGEAIVLNPPPEPLSEET